jgi:hypothetical protein
MQTLTLQLPEDILQHYQRGAMAARKPLEDFITDRLVETPLPLNTTLPAPVEAKLKAMEALADESLWEIAKRRLPPPQQRHYNRLLSKNVQGTITEAEKKFLQALGDEARLLTLEKAHAFMLLKWRGHSLPPPEVL